MKLYIVCDLCEQWGWDTVYTWGAYCENCGAKIQPDRLVYAVLQELQEVKNELAKLR